MLEFLLVAGIAAHLRSSLQGDGTRAFLAARQDAGRRESPEDRSLTLHAMTGATRVGVALREIAVAAHPARVVDGMHAVRSVQRRCERVRRVTRGALDQRARVALQLQCRHVVVRRRVRVRPLRMRAAMAVLARDAAVALRKPVQRLVLGEA